MEPPHEEMRLSREEMWRRIALAEKCIEEEKTRAEQEKREIEQEKRELDVLRQRVAPSRLLDYLQYLEDKLHGTFRLPPISSTNGESTSQTTRVNGKFYPRRLLPWEGFRDEHDAQFNKLVVAFGDRGLFPAQSDVDGVSRDLSPMPRDELDLRPFVRASMEKPAIYIVSAYLKSVGDLRYPRINFQSSYGLEPTTTLSEEDDSVDRNDIPDRWGVGDLPDGSCTQFLVGEYKAAHKLPAKKLHRVLSSAPGPDFFAQAIKHKDADAPAAEDDDTGSAANVSVVPDAASSAVNTAHKAGPGDVYIARVLCQAYHYMITSGLEFGYVASGDGLVFLRVPEDDPQTLYYFVFPVSHPKDIEPQEASQETSQEAKTTHVANRREPRHTAAAYLATLCMLALQSSPRPRSWVAARDYDLKTWPVPYDDIVPEFETDVPPLPDTDGRGGGGLSMSLPKRPRTESHSAATTKTAAINTYGPYRGYIAPIPTLPYCTQACLRGLCDGSPLDLGCPNVGLHRAAWQSTAPGSRVVRLTNPVYHPLTAAALCDRLVSQLAADMDEDCDCLDRWGCYGHYGVLFKIVITGYGYTLVAKGVQAVHRFVLEKEAAVYNALAARPGPPLQGRLIPVFLGIADLERALPLRSCARVPHLMLMSHAGPTLDSAKTRKMIKAAGLNWEEEEERTRLELEAAGLDNEDVRPANLAWNAEAKRVMQLDFDQAVVRPLRSQRPAAPAPAPEPAPKAALSPESPLLKKRDLDARNDVNEKLSESPKRVRVSAL